MFNFPILKCDISSSCLSFQGCYQTMLNKFFNLYDGIVNADDPYKGYSIIPHFSCMHSVHYRNPNTFVVAL